MISTNELVVDNFAGGGGASTGIEAALGRPPIVTKHFGGVVGHRVDRVLGTVTARDHHALTAAFLTKFYGTSTGSSLGAPAPTVTASGHHLGLVMVHGQPYEITDIGMRMLQPHELFAAQGFPATYEGRPLTKTAQTALAGNSVCPQIAKALVVANTRAAYAGEVWAS